ncbi:DUF1761 domain-containing protein [Bacillus sp. FJAT-26390]|uniref:DUF1761 domain-containing protein n=1 Tax=Bacillus sp. FJAT-26390 TaxID=1743142 RepID=UPI0008081194|nr:DUF1761 domain-containing protein [Bacillus sp. FJAT-26390]OBZ13188.1 DUF1761 domain-containing protein [Bacillus sp. FJAT-26390]
MSMDWSALNVVAILAGGVMYMLYGTIYYSVRLSDKKGIKNKAVLENQSEGPLKYICSVIIAFVSSFLVAVLIQLTGAENALQGLGIGLIIGLLITIVYLKNSLFGLMSRRSLLIAVGDHLIIFLLLGCLHGLMA